MVHPFRERKMEIQPAATNNIGDPVNNQLMVVPPVHENASSLFVLCKSLFPRVLFICLTGIYLVLTRPIHLDRVASTQLYANRTVFDFHIYVSENERMPNFSDPTQFVWMLTGLTFGDWYSGENQDSTYSYDTEIRVPEEVQKTGSYYLHVFLVRTGGSPVPSTEGSEDEQTVHRVKQLNRFKNMKRKTRNLPTAETETTDNRVLEDSETVKEEIVSYWHPNLTINIVYDNTEWIKGATPEYIDSYLEFTPSGEFYKPIVYFNDFWNLVKDYQPFNSSVKTIPLRLTWQPLSNIVWRWYIFQSTKNQSADGSLLHGEGSGDNNLDEDQDSLKEDMLKTNPKLFGMQLFLSILAFILKFLAFKNDIQFWRKRESLVGLSVRSVFVNIFQSLIVLLYFLDHENKIGIRIICFIGLGIEVWKITKVVNVKIDLQNPYMGFIPVRISDKNSYVGTRTKEYDAEAFKSLSRALYPLFIAYAIYSFVYGEEHQRWYSWVISMLYGFIFMFGFIMAIPQLFINYKLKSVAHLPWRMMIYKAFDTFIEDLAESVMKTRSLFRLGDFRNDFIFLVFLYQRWIYRVDPLRPNDLVTSQEILEPHHRHGIIPNADPAIEAAAAPQIREEVIISPAPKPLEEKKKE